MPFLAGSFWPGRLGRRAGLAAARRARRAQRLLLALRDDAAGHLARAGGPGRAAERIPASCCAREQQTRQAEDRLREFIEAFQASPNGVVLIDEQGRISGNYIQVSAAGIDAERDLLVSTWPTWCGTRPRGLPRVVELRPRRDHRCPLDADRGRTRQAHASAGAGASLCRNRRLLLTRDITALEQADRDAATSSPMCRTRSARRLRC